MHKIIAVVLGLTFIYLADERRGIVYVNDAAHDWTVVVRGDQATLYGSDGNTALMSSAKWAAMWKEVNKGGLSKDNIQAVITGK